MVDIWERVKSDDVHDYGIFKVRRDESRSPRTGRVHQFHVLEMPNWVNVIPLTPEGRVVMIRQYRHGAEAVGLEIPGGMVDEGEALAAAAVRELEEETGYTAASVVLLGEVSPNPALQDNQLSCFLAQGAVRNRDQVLDTGEDIDVEELDLEEVTASIRDGRLNHSLVIAAFHLFDIYSRERPRISGSENEK